MTVSLEDIVIRHDLAPGDLGYVLYLHGQYYHRHHGYGYGFESYAALAIHEFYRGYDPRLDRGWVCEHRGRIVGSLVLMHRGNDSAQLRFFLVMPEYRGIGLGRRLLELFLELLRERRYRSAFLWTTDEQTATAALYRRFGFSLTEERSSDIFGKPLREHRYDLAL